MIKSHGGCLRLVLVNLSNFAFEFLNPLGDQTIILLLRSRICKSLTLQNFIKHSGHQGSLSCQLVVEVLCRSIE